ncbi:MAG: HAMP domain-containing sensor histidine kinase [Campylobacterota bacterium]|nr:HAMP domain-containing sensor histidine kinase [Campylobacterota bacterium]
MVIKLSEKESLYKGIILFFVVIELFLLFIFYNYYKIEEEHLREQLFLEMKNYSFFFDDTRFNIDIVSNSNQKLYELHSDKINLFILTPMEEDTLLKIYYPLEKYNILLTDIKEMIYLRLLLFSLIAMGISLLFSLYALRPLRDALELLEEFIKDIIHDLNTPLTSILINIKMIDIDNEEIQSIKQSTNIISMLHKNLDLYLKDMHFQNEKFLLKNILEEQILFFASMYDYLSWEVDIVDRTIYSDKNAFSRIIYNLLSNACKYNTSNGFVKVYTSNNTINISNDSYGIKNPSKIFDRFYKEGERGLGIGLHIVEKLCTQLEIEKKLHIDERKITISLIIK